LQLSSDFQCEGSRGVNPRIECRSCWQTFPVPEGLLWMVAAEQAAGTTEEKDEAGHAGEAGSEAAGTAADKITRGLTVLLRQILEELEGARAAQLASIEAKFSGDVAGLREQTASLTAIEQLLAPKVTATEAAQRALEAQQNSLNDRVGSLDGLVQALQGRLVTQADAIRDLHATVEDQAKHRADLLSAARKLQEIAGVIEPSKPLPEGL
jgi:chromosome segregation ATPase